jgi:hypothetical protein
MPSVLAKRITVTLVRMLINSFIWMAVGSIYMAVVV